MSQSEEGHPESPEQHKLTRDLPPPIGLPSWRVRRTVVILTLLFCAAITVYLVGWGPDDELRNTIASGVLFLAGSVIMGYIFGVVWNDNNLFKSSPKEDPYAYSSYGGMYYRGAGRPDGEG